MPEHSRPADRTSAFLNELRKREELMERGVDIVPGRRPAPVVDIDAANVREVEEK